MIIDAHAHFVPHPLLDEALSQRSFPSVKAFRENGGVRLAFAGQEAKRPVPAGISDVPRRHKWLADRGIDQQVVGGWLDMFGYDLPPDEGQDWNRFQRPSPEGDRGNPVSGAACDGANAVGEACGRGARRSA